MTLPLDQVDGSWAKSQLRSDCQRVDSIVRQVNGRQAEGEGGEGPGGDGGHRGRHRGWKDRPHSEVLQ